MGLLSRDDIFAADDLKYDEVHVPEWGGSVRVRGLTGTERDSFESSLIDAKRDAMKLDNVRAKLVAKCAVDENGARLFTDADVRELGRKSGLGLNRVYECAQRLSGITEEDVEELAGNSDGDPDDGSPSD